MSTADFDTGSSNDGFDYGLLGPGEDLVPVEHIAGCGCAACQGASDKNSSSDSGTDGVDPTGANPDTGNVGQLLTMGVNPDGSRYFSGNRNVDATLIGSRWGITNLTYSFPTSGSNYSGNNYDSNGVSNYHIDLGTQQQAAARASFAQIAAATGLTFTEITETDTVHANIRISQSADSDVASAYGNFPSDTRGVAGDIWFGRTNQPYYDMAYRGTWGFATMMHEIGHTMGLKHGHQDYTNSDLSFYFGTTPRFGSQSLTPDRDGQAWSLMTYTPAPFTNSNFAGEKVNQPQTYMQYDLAALQYLYGANYNTNNTDTVYTFSQTTGEMFINGVGQGAPSGNKIFLTIWDGGGNDTIDVSNYNNGVTIDLRPGEFSTVDSAQLANSLAYQNLTSLAPGNFAMSLLYNNDARSLIENAIGGNGNDMFIGNIANNFFDGRGGSDTVVFTSVTGVNVTLNDTGTDVVVTHDGETDTLRSIENIVGTSGNDVLIGNNQDNALYGSLGGADTLTGNDGNDTLVGGSFNTVNNALITKAGTTVNLGIATAVNPQAANAYTLLSDANITNSTTTPHATINATAAGGGLEYYRVDATAGATAIFDIDNSSIDTWIELVNSSGTVLANNDDGASLDAGSTSSTNSYLTYTFTTAGTYYIRVGRWTQAADVVAQPLAAGTTYQLHISLSSATVNTAPLSAVNTSSATLDGGNGNDLLVGTLGDDTINGGADNDTASFINAFSNTATGVTVNLNIQGVAQFTFAAGTDTLSGIENLIGSQYNDTLFGDGNDNVIEGGAGNDTLVGGGGNDTASYASASGGVTVFLALQDSAQNTRNAGSDTLSGFENLLGSAFNDTLVGDANANTLTGGAGNDVLDVGNSAVGVSDLLDGGSGTDTASFNAVSSGVVATLNGALDGTATQAGNLIATLRNIESLSGTSSDDVLTGDANDNSIEGGLGNDTLDGGLGNDTLVFTGNTNVTVDLSITTAQNTGWGNDTISGFENVRTLTGNDTITGDGNDNIFFDGGGNDIYNGAAGVDTINYTNITTAVTVNLNTLTAQTVSTSNSDTITNIENVTGSLTAANTITGGDSTSNRLVGGAAADFLIGRGLGDTLIGGAGNDVLFGDYVNTFSATVGIADGNDVIEGGDGSDSLVGGLGNDILRGGAGDDILVGGLANGTASGLTTVYTNDAGDDTFDGGDGTDTAYAYFTDHTGGIGFDLRNLDGNSAITTGGIQTGSFISIERVIFRGGTGDDVVYGTGYLDTLVGNAGNDYLNGYYGNDTLSGGAGNDTLDGGEGLDTVTYVNATSGVNVDLRITTAQDTGGEGIDTLLNIEYITGSGFGDTLRGDDDFNLIIDNSVAAGGTAFSQTDRLYGNGGNDSILVTRAAADVATNILMDGGDGNDILQLVAGTVTTTTSDPDGLSSGATYALPGRAGTRNADNVTVSAGTGNDRVVLTGVNTATVDLGTGNDTVSISTLGVAGTNAYDITTGTGQDVIWLAGTGAANSSNQATTVARNTVVRDFTVGDAGDRFELRNTTAATSYINTTNFTGLIGGVNSDLFDSGHMRLVQSGSDILLQVDRDGAAGATSTFVTIATLAGRYTGGFTAFNFDGMVGQLNLTGIGALDETFTGASKADTLNGGDGDDTLVGLGGNDILVGGNGIDTASYRGARSDYTITRLSSTSVSIVDNRGSSPDGTDTVTAVERFAFSNGTLTMADIFAPSIGGTGTPVEYTEQAAAIVVAGALTITDLDSTTLAGVQVAIQDGRQPGDVLNFVNQGTIAGSFNSATGILTLTGTASVADYQAALRTITFANLTNDDPTAGGTALTRSIAWTANDGEFVGSSVFTTINVTAVNDAPTATNLSAAENYVEDTPLNLTDIVASDIDSATVTARLTLSNPAAGTLSTGTSGSVTSTFAAGVWTATGSIADVNALLAAVSFNPAANFNGSFTIATSVSDGSLEVTGSKTFTGTAVNDAPTGTDVHITMLEDARRTFSAADFGFSDGEGNTLAGIRITTLPTAGTLTLNGVAVAAGDLIAVASVPLLSFTPALNANGPGHASFTFQVQDNGGTANGGVDLDQSPNTITFDVTPVNDAPSGTNAILTILEDTPRSFAASDFGFSDIDGNALAAVRISSLPNAGAGRLTLNGNAVTVGTLVPVASLPQLVFTPAANANGFNLASFTFQVQDDGGTSNGGVNLDQSPNRITFNVTAVNDAPSGADATFTLNEDSSRTMSAADFGFSDIDSPSLAAVRITTLPTAGTLTLNGVAIGAGVLIPAARLSQLVFTPAANANGNGYASFTFQVQDSGSGTNLDPTPNTITFNVTPVNDAPSGTDATLTTRANTPRSFAAADFGFSDVDGDAFAAVRITSLPTAGTLTLNGNVVAAGALIAVASLPQLVFTPAANASGNGYASFTFQVQDNGGTANGGVNLDPIANTITIDITAANELRGTPNADRLVGTAASEIISGLGDNDVIIGGGGNDLIDGGDGNDVIIAGSGNDVINGGAGSDQISAGDGNDTLDGGSTVAGQEDILIGGLGNDIYVTALRGTSIMEAANEGIDEVRASSSVFVLPNHVENLTYTGSGSFLGFGNALDNVITGGTGADGLVGDAGNDTLDGGTGAANELIGGTGDDIYVVRVAGDTIIEFAGEGSDTVQTALASYTLRPNVENLVYTGSAAFTGVGSADNNSITGGSGDDALSGLDGNDILTGGTGADMLIGGNGADQFRYLGGETGLDRIIDFTSGTDRIALALSGFARTATLDFVSGAGAVANSTNSTFLYDTNTGIVSYDADGTGAGAAVQLAQLNTGLSLTVADFVFV